MYDAEENILPLDVLQGPERDYTPIDKVHQMLTYFILFYLLLININNTLHAVTFFKLLLIFVREFFRFYSVSVVDT